jgi:hypothetical protein
MQMYHEPLEIESRPLNHRIRVPMVLGLKWGSAFFVILGGEPVLCWSKCKGFEVVRFHHTRMEVDLLHHCRTRLHY